MSGETWYEEVSRDNKLPTRCRYAACDLCPRYLETWKQAVQFPQYSELGPIPEDIEAASKSSKGATIAQAAKPEIRRHNTKVKNRSGEEWSEEREEWSRACPEVAYACSLTYASRLTNGLYPPQDPEDGTWFEDEEPEPMTLREHAMHFLDCPEYPVNATRHGDPTNDLRESHSATLRSVTEPIDLSTPMGQTLFSILAGMAQQERQSITERTLAGKRAKAAKGGFAGATAPYGYRTDGHGGLVIHETEAEVVRGIFAARAEGETLKQISDGLNAQAIPTRRARKWHPGTVRYILDNPKYRGEVEYFFRWESEKTRVIRDGEHVAIVGG